MGGRLSACRFPNRPNTPLSVPPSFLVAARKPDDALEPTPEHAFAVEGHLRGLHRVLELRILHDRLADPITVLLVSIHAPGQRDDLTVLELYGLWERRDLAGLSVIADRVAVIQSAVPQVGVAPYRGHALVGVEVGTGNGDDDSVDVGSHGGPPLM